VIDVELGHRFAWHCSEWRLTNVSGRMHCPLSGNVTDVLFRDQFVSILRSHSCWRHDIFHMTKRSHHDVIKALSLRLCSTLFLFLNVNIKLAWLAIQIPVRTVATVWWHSVQVYWQISGWLWEPGAFFKWLKRPYWPGSCHYRHFTVTLRHSTLGMNSLDKWSAPRRYLCLTTNNIRYR
jgi:hypothetical protein